MSDEYDILIEDDGTTRFVYSDELAEVFADERLHTVRASHVEPHPTKTGWTADMRPVGGRLLGDGVSYQPDPDATDMDIEYYFDTFIPPFTTRQVALDAEREWLRERFGV